MKNRIKKLRKSQYLTLEYLSYVSAVSVSYLNKLERGIKVNPSDLVMQNIANALGVPVSEVFFD